MLILFLSICCRPVSGQTRVEVTLAPGFQYEGPLYLAGSHNGWDPARPQDKLIPDGQGRWYILLDRGLNLPLKFKFTGGSWNLVETDREGRDIPDRILDKIPQETTLTIQIAGIGPAPRQSTAGPGVRIFGEALHIPGIQRTRAIRVYLPPGYDHSDRRYPVWYMQDGQNLFDELTAFAGEWQIDEYLDGQDNHIYGCIIVGIDHGGVSRLDEYTHWHREGLGGGQGAAYGDFIAHTVKPLIDSMFRTITCREYTTIGGSSMGALLALNTFMDHPDIFGQVAAFSPSCWFSRDSLMARVQSFEAKDQAHIYLLAGDAESEDMVPDLRVLADLLSRKDLLTVTTVVRAGGRHEERFWSREFGHAFGALYQSPDSWAVSPDGSWTLSAPICPGSTVDYPLPFPQDRISRIEVDGGTHILTGRLPALPSAGSVGPRSPRPRQPGSLSGIEPRRSHRDMTVTAISASDRADCISACEYA